MIFNYPYRQVNKGLNTKATRRPAMPYQEILSGSRVHLRVLKEKKIKIIDTCNNIFRMSLICLIIYSSASVAS